jgi:hypothetical protein
LPKTGKEIAQAEALFVVDRQQEDAVSRRQEKVVAVGERPESGNLEVFRDAPTLPRAHGQGDEFIDGRTPTLLEKRFLGRLEIGEGVGSFFGRFLDLLGDVRHGLPEIVGLALQAFIEDAAQEQRIAVGEGGANPGREAIVDGRRHFLGRSPRPVRRPL